MVFGARRIPIHPSRARRQGFPGLTRASQRGRGPGAFLESCEMIIIMIIIMLCNVNEYDKEYVNVLSSWNSVIQFQYDMI